MNKVDKLLLSLVLQFKKIYTIWGCDIQQLKAIVTIKLIMDNRRPHPLKALQQNKNQTDKPINNATIWSMLGSLIMGLFLLMFMMFDDVVTNLTLYFSTFCSLLALTLISDFTHLLLDVRDNYIILPKPINDKTFVLAKLLHVIIHLSKLVIPLVLPTLIYIGVSFSFLGGIVFIPFVFLATLFIVFLVNAFYLLVLKITTPEKFKNIITFIQIIFGIGIYAASQIIPRKIGQTGITFKISNYAAAKFFPTYWFAKSWNAIYTLNFSRYNVFYILLSIIFPLLAIYLVIKYLAPSFNQKLSQIAGSNNNDSKGNSVEISKSKKSNYSNNWASLTTKTGEERMGFLFTWKMMLRSRDFKLKVYPSIGYIFVMIFIMFMDKKSFSITNVINGLKVQDTAGKISLLMVVYISSLVVFTAISNMVMSEKFKAAWIYFITPIYKPGKIILGSLKAVCVMFLLPLIALALVLGLMFAGLSILPNLALAIVNQLLIILLFSLLNTSYFPFSTAVYKPNAGAVFKNIFAMLFATLIGVLHFFVYDYILLVVLFIALDVTLIYFITRQISANSWQKIMSIYRE
jgi:ABC-2 type transport system permease protein